MVTKDIRALMIFRPLMLIFVATAVLITSETPGFEALS